MLMLMPLMMMLSDRYAAQVGMDPLAMPWFMVPVLIIGGMFIVNRLPMHYHAVLKYEHIQRGLDDRFFVVIEARDPKFNLAATRALLEQAGGQAVTELEA